MSAPVTTDYRLKRYGHADPGGETDTWNRYCKYLWGDITAYSTEYGSGTGEHDRDGDHMADLLALFWKTEPGTYTGNAADDRDITLSDGTLDVKMIRIWEASTATTWFRSEDMAGDATCSTIGEIFTDAIQSVGTGEFQVGTLLNVAARVYYYVAYGV